MDNFIAETKKLVNSLVISEPLIGVLAYTRLVVSGLISSAEAESQILLLQHDSPLEIPDEEGYITMTPELESLIMENKYYLNLYGVLHKTDSPVLIKLIETNYEAELTKDLLEQYKDTKKELLSCGDYYKNIINNNYEMIDYIHGCMYPVDPITTYRSERGDILAYNSNFIEEQEDYLLEALRKYTSKFLGLSLNKSYFYNNPFYVASYLFILRSYLTPICIGERLSKINTMYAHKFFLEIKFRSTLDVWEEIQNLNNKTMWWLYANIDRYVRHIGSNETFQELLHNVLGENSIGIGTYRCIRRDPIPDNSQYDYETSPYNNKPIVVNTKKLNNAYTANEDQDCEISELNTELIELTSDGNTDKDNFVNEVSTNLIKHEFTGPFDTKVAEISTLENFTSYNFDIFKLLLDYWAYFLNNDIYGSFTKDLPTVYVEFQDPNTLQQYNIDSKIGFLIAMKILLHASGKTVLDKGLFTISNVLNWKFTLKDVMDKSIFQDGYTEKLFNTINDLLPSELKQTSSVSEVSSYLNGVVNFFKKYWLLTSNVENPIVSANLYRIIHVLTVQEEFYFKKSITTVDIDNVLEENGVKFVINGNYDHMLALNELFKSVLGIEPNSDIKLKDLLASYKSLIRKMKSYTVEVTGKVKSENKNEVCYQHIGPMFSKIGMLKLYKDKVSGKLLEDEYYISKFEVYEPNEKSKAVPYLEKLDVVKLDSVKATFTIQAEPINYFSNLAEIKFLEDV